MHAASSRHRFKRRMHTFRITAQATTRTLRWGRENGRISRLHARRTWNPTPAGRNALRGSIMLCRVLAALTNDLHNTPIRYGTSRKLRGFGSGAGFETATGVFMSATISPAERARL